MRKNDDTLLFVVWLSLLLLLCFTVTSTCRKIEKSMLVSTGEVTGIETNSAEASGMVVDLGDGATQHGHCYGTVPNVTVAGSRTQLGKPSAGGFTSQLTGLTAGTKYYVKAYISSASETVYGKEIPFTTSAASLPVLTTAAITTVTFTTATSGGEVTSDGGAPVTERGVCWNTASGPSVTNSKTTDASGTGVFTSNLSGLTPGTTYYVRAYATSAAGTAYGNELIFTTTAVSLPVITTAAITEITQTSALSGGEISSDGGSSVTSRGVCWSTSVNPAVALSTKTTDGTGTGSFASNITGLTANTTYHVRAYATNSAGTAYGNDLIFTTGAASTVPGAPTIGTATAGNAQATVIFTAPASNGGSAITGYTVTSSPGNITGTGTVSPVTVTGLTNGTAYTFTVTATNAIGTGPASAASNSVTPTAPSTVPGAPTIGTATAGNAQATVTFTAPASDGSSAITGYTVTSNPEGKTATGTSSPITVTGLTNGTAYTFTVTATNANGMGTASAASNSVTPSTALTVPGAPTGVSAVPGYEKATVSFTAPVNDGGSAITGYTVTSSPGGFVGTGSSSPISVTGLPALIAYTFTVTATNAIGTGPVSAATNSVTPTTLPGAPTIGTATKGNAQATVTFTPPASDGGSAITGYTATSNPGSFTGTSTTANPITVAGLTNGTTYTFTVVATNNNGNSLPSTASNSVTPSTVPGAPIIGTATAEISQAIVAFTAPVSDGGSSITGYTAISSPGAKTGTSGTSPITVTGLTNGTAYTFTVTATNANGTGSASAASNSVMPGRVSDVDGNTYIIVAIGTQTWMAENLNTTKYNDGTAIPNVTDGTTWTALTTGAYSDYNNTPSNSTTYGRLYNWYTVDNNASTKVTSNGGKNVCPVGWHVPNDAEWHTLILYLDGSAVFDYDESLIAGGKLKATGTTYWITPNTGATNESGFTAIPGGARGSGSFINLGYSSHMWSSTEEGENNAFGRGTYYNNTKVTRGNGYKNNGFSVRCIKD
jgi:uncharacterized protein (TIGR02145 family)